MESKKRNKKAKNKQNKATASNAAPASVKAAVSDVTVIDENSVVPDAALRNGKPCVSDGSPVDDKISVSESVDGPSVEKDQQTQQHGVLDSEIPAISNPHYHLDKQVDPLQVDLIEMLKTLQKEIDSCTKREATLDERIQNLCKENKSYLHDTANYALKLEELQCAIDSRIAEEVGLKERIKILEFDKDMQIKTETSKRELIDELSSANIILQNQVMLLEESRGTLIEENQEIKKRVSSLETRIQQLEAASILRSSAGKTLKHSSVEEKLLHEIHTMQLTEDPILENTKALGVEEVIDPYATHEHALASKIETASEAKQNAISVPYLSESFSDKNSASHINTEVETCGTPNDSHHLHEVNSVQIANPVMSLTSIPVNTTTVADVLQLPLDEIQTKQIKPTVQSIEGYENQEILQVSLDEIQIEEINPAVKPEEEAVPLTEAPLIGAPFRLISFVAKYVSGADLVSEKSSASHR